MPLERPDLFSDVNNDVPPDLQLRTEYARSVDDAETYKAIYALQDLGLLAPMADMELYHGRAAPRDSGATQWVVDPEYENGGGRNIYARSVLYVGSPEDAFDFANSRGNQQEPFIEGDRGRLLKNYVHKIESSDSDAMIINLESAKEDGEFHERLKVREDGLRYFKAAKALALPLTEGSPVAFDDRNSVEQLMRTLAGGNYASSMIPDADFDGIAQRAGVDRRLVVQVASAYNARRLFRGNMADAVDMLLHSSGDLVRSHDNHTFNMEYIQRCLEKAHIVGSFERVESATIRRDAFITAVFNKHTVNKPEAIATGRESMNKELGGVAASMAGVLERQGEPSALVRGLQNAYVKPETLVAEAAKVVGEFGEYGRILSMPTGNWEGFVLSEHIETVLRNFDETYADRVPVELLGPMRLALLVHDMGKPVARAKGRQNEENKFNVEYAGEFMKKAGVPDDLNKFVLAMVGKGESLAFAMNIGNNDSIKESARNSLVLLAKDTLRRFRGGEATEEQIKGFMEMCTMLQVCDGGAYTSMAVTQKAGSAVQYRNHPSFNHSFGQPNGPGKRDLNLRGVGYQAEMDLTPKQQNGRQ